LLQLAHHQTSKTHDCSRARQGNKSHRTRLAGLKAHRGACGDVEAKPPRSRAIKIECRIGLSKVIVRTHLDWPVTGIGHTQLDRWTTRIQFNLARFGE